MSEETNNPSPPEPLSRWDHAQNSRNAVIAELNRQGLSCTDAAAIEAGLIQDEINAGLHPKNTLADLPAPLYAAAEVVLSRAIAHPILVADATVDVLAFRALWIIGRRYDSAFAVFGCGKYGVLLRLDYFGMTPPPQPQPNNAPQAGGLN